MKLFKRSFLLLIFVFIVFLFQNNSYAGTQRWNSLNYDVTIQETGDMRVVETWDIYICDTIILFEQFDVDLEKYTNITDVNVYEITDNGEKALNQIYEEQFYVTPGCFYALITSEGKYEIAWNVESDKDFDNRKYKICYTVEGVAKQYNDCSEWYWMFLKDTNKITGENITGTITLPKGISNIENLRVWGHGPLNAEIKKESTNKISFSVPEVKKNEMLEVRIVCKERIFEVADISYEDKLESILEEEQLWEDKTNRIRENIREDSKKQVKKAVLANIVCVIAFIIIIKIVMKNGKANLALEYESYDIEYFRDIPNEKDATPARATYIKSFNGITERSAATEGVFAGTILDLILRGFIEIEPIDYKSARFKLKDSVDVTELPNDENLIYRILQSTCEENSSNTITTKDLEKYCKKNYDVIYAKRKALENTVKKYEKNKIDKDKMNVQKQYLIKGIIYICLLCFSLPLIVYAPTFVIGSGILAMLSFIYATKIEVLTETGYREKKEWKALQKYMEDFSLLKDKEIPDLILWEKYLVYATTFGISKKVINQLKIVYPQLMDDSTYINGNYKYLHYIANSSYGFDFFSNLDKILSKSYSGANLSYTVSHSMDSSGSDGGDGSCGDR